MASVVTNILAGGDPAELHDAAEYVDETTVENDWNIEKPAIALRPAERCWPGALWSL